MFKEMFTESIKSTIEVFDDEIEIEINTKDYFVTLNGYGDEDEFQVNGNIQFTKKLMNLFYKNSPDSSDDIYDTYGPLGGSIRSGGDAVDAEDQEWDQKALANAQKYVNKVFKSIKCYSNDEDMPWGSLSLECEGSVKDFEKIFKTKAKIS